jgi:hypothetical protein
MSITTQNAPFYAKNGISVGMTTSMDSFTNVSSRNPITVIDSNTNIYSVGTVTTANLVVTGATALTGNFDTSAINISGQLTSTAVGVAPFVVNSRSTVANLSSNYLNGNTFDGPGPIGSVNPSTGNFTTVYATEFLGKILTASQTNITQVGQLTDLITVGDVSVGGNLVVHGSTVTVDSTTITTADKVITLASGAFNNPTANGSGLLVSGSNATWYYTSNTDTWDSNKDIVAPTFRGNVTGTAANITGTLAVSQGGTGATATTGSGNNVLATSPSLVTPILGTPTSGNLTNCTGYPWANITGLAPNITTFANNSTYMTQSTPSFTGAMTGSSPTGGVSITVAGDIIGLTSSDDRLKTNKLPITNALDKVLSLNGFTFNWNAISERDMTIRQAGISAQEVEKILPEIVETRETGFKAVDYEKLAPLLIEAIKELKAEIDALKAK